MPELMIAVADESGLEGQDISKYLDGQIALDRFEHTGTHPLFMIFHWHLSSTGVNHSVSIIDSYFRMRDFSAKNLNRKNLGIEKISILLPPDGDGICGVDSRSQERNPTQVISLYTRWLLWGVRSPSLRKTSTTCHSWLGSLSSAPTRQNG